MVRLERHRRPGERRAVELEPGVGAALGEEADLEQSALVTRPAPGIQLQRPAPAPAPSPACAIAAAATATTTATATATAAPAATATTIRSLQGSTDGTHRHAYEWRPDAASDAQHCAEPL